MKNLFSVLLIATFAIASTVAAQEVPQAGVKASKQESPNPETILEQALWQKKHHHHKNQECRNKIITLPFLECEHECDNKCESGGRECDMECETVDHICKDECKHYEGECGSKCEHRKGECRGKCKYNDSTCNSGCDSVAVDTCTDNGGDPGQCYAVFTCKARCKANFKSGPGLDANCDKLCDSTNCGGTCTFLTTSRGLIPNDGTTSTTACYGVCGDCYERCFNIFGDEPDCTEVCNIDADCRVVCGTSDKECNEACTTCDKECGVACQEGGEACGKACESGKDWCKGKCEYGERKCFERCKPCRVECKNACYEDEERCISNCKDYIGSDQECRNKCKRDCGSVCKGRCKHCFAHADADLAEASAPNEDPTIATISAQL